MVHKDFLYDYLTSRVISQGKTIDGCGRIYFKTNEDLISLCLPIDFYHKDVLSVLASSDQVFTARLLEANTVEAFDKNRLTLYYYYLRIWSIKYANCLYPNVMDGNQWLKELLKRVKPENDQEQLALIFFKKHIKDDTDMSNLFYDVEKNPIGKNLYSTAKEIVDCTSSELVFHSVSLFEKLKLNKTYDIIIISNILEWARGDRASLTMARDNLNRLLRKKGTVICSRLINLSEDIINIEEEIFRECFKKEPIEKGYTYIKK